MWVGWYSIQVGRAVGNSGRAVALEPDTLNRGQLERNLALNKLGNVQILPLAPKASSLRNRFPSMAFVVLSWFLGRQVRRLAGPDLIAVVSNGPFGWYLPGLPKSVRKVHFYRGTYRGQADMIRPYIAFTGALKLKWWDSMVLERQSGRGKLVVCNSDQTRREVQEYFGYSGETIWLPLDTVRFAPLDKLESRRKLELPEAKEIGLFVGSAHPAKGFSTVRKLIDAFPEIHWCLALRGSISEDLAGNPRLSIYRN